MTTPVFHLASDESKTPVALADQKPGTKLKAVLAGKERTIEVGKFVVGGHQVDETKAKEEEESRRSAAKAKMMAAKAKMMAAKKPSK